MPPAVVPVRLPVMRSLQAFEAVARCGSVAAAAEELGVSPGAISQQLRKIEQALGVCLVQRSGKGVELTTWGRLYHDGIAPAFVQLREAQARLRTACTRPGLVLSCLPSVASRWMGPRLFEWQAKHPQAKVRLVGAEAEPPLVAGEVDFRITYGRAVLQHLHHAPLFVDQVVPACAPSLLPARGPLTPQRLLKLPLISIDWDAAHGSAPRWADWCDSLGLGERPTQEALGFSLSSAAIDAAVNGRGIVLAQRSLITEDLASGRLVVPVAHALPLAQGYHLAWDRSTLERPQGLAFRDWILAMARAQSRALAQAPRRSPR